MQIQQIQRYRLNGCEFNSLCDVRTYVEGEICRLVDSGGLPLTPQSRKSVMEAILKNHKSLRAMLSIEYARDDGELQPEVTNILDIDV